MLKKVIILLTLFTAQFYSQQIGTWQNYTDMKNISATVFKNNQIWAATGGGGFVYNIDDSTYAQFTQSEGLTNQILSAIEIDNENKIWFGSTNGAINIYNPEDQSTSAISDIVNSDKKIKTINELYSNENIIYVSTSFGISVINSSNLTYDDTYQKLGEFPSETDVKSVFKTDLLYAATAEGIAVQKEGATNLTSPDSWISYLLGDDINATSVSKVSKYNNSIIAATDNGIFKLTGNLWTSEWLSGSDIIDLITIGNVIYCLTPNNLISYDGSNQQILYTSTNEKLKKLEITDDTSFLISTDKGVRKIDGNESSIIFPNGPASNLFIHLTIDTDGNLWSASGKNGAGVGFYKFDGESWTNYNKSNVPEMKTNDYHKTFSGKNGTVYMASWGYGFTKITDGEFETFDVSNTDMIGTSDDNNWLVINSLQEDDANNIWVLNYWAGDRNVLWKVSPENVWTPYNFSSPYLSNTDLTHDLVIDQYDTKWFSTTNKDEASKGLFYINENGIPSGGSDYGSMTTSDGLSQGNITALAIDTRGELWIGKTPGIDILQTPSHPNSSPISRVNAFLNQNISCVAVDPINRKWVGTFDGVYVLSADGYEIIDHFTSKNSPLPIDDIKSIAIDSKSGTVYIGTDYGLSSLKTSSVEPVESFEEIFCYPNPFKIDNSNNKIVTIEGLIKSVEVKVLSISGKLIRILESGSEFSPGGKLAFWDGRDESGSLVQSGVYIIVAYDNDGSNVKSAKIAVVRK